MRSWFLFLLCTGIISCSAPAPTDWTDLVPDKTPFLIIPEEGRTFNDMLDAPYMSLFDDMSGSAIQMAGELVDRPETDVPLIAILLYPDTSSDWQPVWVTDSGNSFIETLTQQFQRAFAQNRYEFKDHTIDILYVNSRTFYIVDTGSGTLVSESSLAIEDMLRTLHGELQPMALTEEQTRPGAFIANTPSLEQWIGQLARISYRPLLQDSFAGSGPLSTVLSDTSPGEGNLRWRLHGQMETAEKKSPLVRGISAPSGDIQLDRFISTNSSAFSIFRMEPRRVPAAEPSESVLDLYLDENSDLYGEIASMLNSEVAFAAFAESGFMSSSEFYFLRRLDDPDGVRRILNSLVAENLIRREGDSYVLNSRLLGNLFGSDLSSLVNFYITIQGNTAALSRSRSLVESVGTDYERRRVYYYDDNYTSIRETLPEAVSSFTFVNTPEFNTFLQPWLYPQNNVGVLSSNLDIMTIMTSRADENSPLEVDISSYAREITDAPYRERWVFPLSSNLTGAPILTNTAGASRNEIVFSTRNGTVYVVAYDGSSVSETTTMTDTPVGPPVVYDWYGNNQNIIMQAAGNKIYAWNEGGSSLPSFPVILDEEITTPLQVADVTRNGVAEMIVATADRNVHILNSRGDAISGWPRTANSVIRSKPVLAQLGDQRSIFAFAENGLHSWNISGSRRNGFPVFIESRFNGSPVIHDSHILGAAADGALYATGLEPLFFDSLAASSSGDSLITQSLMVSNNSLIRSPSISDEMIRVNDELVREDLILTQSSNGSIQMFNTGGELRFTNNMGQPGSGDRSPLVMDINGDNRQEVISLAESGRLYAWDLVSGNRISELPTSGMNYPVFEDLNGDGNIEIITQTREGLRVWSVYRQRIEEISELRTAQP